MSLRLKLENLKRGRIAKNRKKLFKERIGCEHDDFTLLGDVIVYYAKLKLGKNVTIWPNCMFFGDGVIEIGDNVHIGNNTIIHATKESGGVHIGNDTSIAANCYIIDSDHKTEANELINKQGCNVEPVYIGNDCWLGENVTVLKGSKINDGAVIGAKALVKGEIPKNAIAVGIPAQVKSYRK